MEIPEIESVDLLTFSSPSLSLFPPQFAGIERETTPFVLTREMVYVMGGQGSATYKEFTVRALSFVAFLMNILFNFLFLLFESLMAYISNFSKLFLNCVSLSIHLFF